MIKGTEEVVLELLERNKVLRTDDFLLYCAVLKRIGIDTNKPFREIMINHKILGLPSFETVSRCRRKIQETRQDLIDWGTAVIRADEKEKFINYSRG